MLQADKKSYISDGRLFTVFDSKNKTFSYKLNYPEAMQNKLWGGMLTFKHLCCNSKTNRVIISYAGFDQISVFNRNFKSTKYYKATSDELKSIRSAYKPYEVFEKKNEHYMNMPTFGRIYYDRYRDVYYRIGKFPKVGEYDPNKRDYMDAMANPRDLVIVVLDSKFQKLTEYILKQPKN